MCLCGNIYLSEVHGFPYLELSHSREERVEAGMAGSGVGVCRYRIGFLNVQGLTIAKAVKIRSLIKGGLGGGGDVDGSTKLILGMVETHEKFNRLDWGDDIEHIEQMRDQTDKKGGILPMLKDRDDYKYDKLDNTCKDILNVKLDLGRLNIEYIVLQRVHQA